jgi:hypothetical protein
MKELVYGKKKRENMKNVLMKIIGKEKGMKKE